MVFFLKVDRWYDPVPGEEKCPRFGPLQGHDHVFCPAVYRTLACPDFLWRIRLISRQSIHIRVSQRMCPSVR